MTIWFTADQHFFHQNIIKYCDRPFSDAKEMKRRIINNYNSLVQKEDTVYHLGDFAMANRCDKPRLEKIIRKLHGNKILIFGNHDYLRPSDYVEMGFDSGHTSLELTLDNINLFLVHDPANSKRNLDGKNLCGHIHNVFKKSNNNVLNVGVDVWKFRPVRLKEVEDSFDDLGM